MLKVVTWNVNSIAIRLGQLLALLARDQPALVCLQELKCTEDKFPFEAIRAAGYHATIVGQKAYNGVAVLSREPAEVLSSSFEDGVDDPAARCVAVRASGITCVSVYVPNGQEVGSDKYFYKLNWLARLRRYLEQAYDPDAPLVVAGDFNVAPANRDVYDPAAFRERLLCSTREREALSQVEAFGLIDAYRHLHPAETQFTWWDYRMQGFQANHGLRIDLLLVTRPIISRLSRCYVALDERAADKPSDHAPVVLELL